MLVDTVINDDDDVTNGDVTIGEVVITGDAVIGVGGVAGGLRIASGSHIRPALL